MSVARSDNIPARSPIRATLRAMSIAAPIADAGSLADAAIDLGRDFVCPTLCPLRHTSMWAALDERQRRRLNQLTAMSFNELIAMFESTMLGAVEAAGARTGDVALRSALADFANEERKHIQQWRSLNRASDPERYARTAYAIVPTPSWLRAALAWAARRSIALPCVFWLALALEDHSLEISRRCLRLPDDVIDARYRQAYAEHLEDEARHVRLDLRLLTLLYDPLPRWRKKLVARVVVSILRRWFLTPGRSGRRVLDAFLAEEPSLAPIASSLCAALTEAGRSPSYLSMMYSRSATPSFFRRIDRDPIMREAARSIPTYRPARHEEDADD